MKLRPEDYVSSRRDSVRENDLCRALRRLDSQEMMAFLLRLLELDPNWGIPIARRVVRRVDDAMAILQLSTELTDASSVKFWLQVCLPKLGWSRLLAFIRKQIERNPEWVEDVLYWLPRLNAQIEAVSDQIQRIQEELNWFRDGEGGATEKV